MPDRQDGHWKACDQNRQAAQRKNLFLIIENLLDFPKLQLFQRQKKPAFYPIFRFFVLKSTSVFVYEEYGLGWNISMQMFVDCNPQSQKP
jgi:hypothetical protein